MNDVVTATITSGPDTVPDDHDPDHRATFLSIDIGGVSADAVYLFHAGADRLPDFEKGQTLVIEGRLTKFDPTHQQLTISNWRQA